MCFGPLFLTSVLRKAGAVLRHLGNHAHDKLVLCTTEWTLAVADMPRSVAVYSFLPFRVWSLAPRRLALPPVCLMIY
jgi:hypothetical protein